MKKTLLAIAALGLIWACSTNPLTGRSSLALVSNTELFPQSFTQYKQTLTESKVISGTKDAKMVQTVGERLKYAAEKLYAEKGISNALQGYEWQFTLLDNEEVNAWCMPGGKVAVYSGIMPVCKDATGLAVVLGHEIGHALAGHSAEQMSNSMVTQYGASILGASISNAQWKGAFDRLYPIGSQIGLLKYGRTMELDADETGLYLMALAGYNPSEAVNFWSRMSSATGGAQTSEFLSTHPNPENRIAKIKEHLPKALAYYNASPYKNK